MKILTNEQYKLFLVQQRRIEQLQKENEQLQKDNDEQAQEIYGLREDLASLKWNLNKHDPQLIDFPNSSVESFDQSDELFV